MDNKKPPKPTFLRQLSGSYTGDQLWIDPYTNERVWVFNPMHIVNLSKQTKSKFVRIVEGFKTFSNKWFSHALLILFLILYGFLGAYIFITLEGPAETAAKNPVNNMRDRIIDELWWSSRQFSKGWWQRLAKIRLKEYERQLHESCLADQTTDSEQKVWNLWQALFFSATIFTTIGYGHVVPKTDAGRVASIIYAFIGIPLLLMVLTDLGKLFTRCIKFVYKYWRKIWHNRQMRKMRRPTLFVTQTLDAVNRKMSTVVPLRGRLFSKDLGDGNVDIPKTIEELTDEASETLVDFEVDDEFNLPISVALILLLLYMMAGAALFTMWENWSLFHSFYFIFVSLSTIGFGDYVPEHPAFMMCAFIYLLFGLALTSMCINVVQEKLSATFQQAKLRIGATMGLDMTQLMEEELNQDNANEPPNATGNGAAPKGLLKDEGIGDLLREKREKKRKMSNAVNQANAAAAAAKDSSKDSTSEDTASKRSGDQERPAKAKGKSVDFEKSS